MIGAAEWYLMLAFAAVGMCIYVIIRNTAHLEERPDKEVELNPFRKGELIPIHAARKIGRRIDFESINQRIYDSCKQGKNSVKLSGLSDDHISALKNEGYKVTVYRAIISKPAIYLVSW